MPQMLATGMEGSVHSLPGIVHTAGAELDVSVHRFLEGSVRGGQRWLEGIKDASVSGGSAAGDALHVRSVTAQADMHARRSNSGEHAA